MRKTNHLMAGTALLALAAIIPATATAKAKPIQDGSTGTQGWVIDTSPAAVRTYSFQSHQGGAFGALVKFFLSQNP